MSSLGPVLLGTDVLVDDAVEPSVEGREARPEPRVQGPTVLESIGLGTRSPRDQ